MVHIPVQQTTVWAMIVQVPAFVSPFINVCYVSMFLPVFCNIYLLQHYQKLFIRDSACRGIGAVENFFLFSGLLYRVDFFPQNYL